MKPTEALSGLIKYIEEGAKYPNVWQDGAWKAKYYTYYNVVWEALEEHEQLQLQVSNLSELERH